MLKFYHITDTHLYSKKSLGEYKGFDQKCINESSAILDAVFDKIIAQNEIDIVLISGDLSNNGEKPCHLELVDKLHRLQSFGKKVYVITATHDYELERKENPDPLLLTKRDELRDLYYDFGFNRAIAEFDDKLSYVVQLAPGYRLLCLNDDGNARSFCGYYEPQMKWILEQIEQAKRDGEFIFAMTHHPMLPPSPIYPVFSKRDMLGNYEECSSVLADAGLRFIFTGHTHMQNINSKTTENGNTIFDINTASPLGYPSPIRRIVINETSMNITTEHIESFEGYSESKDIMQHFSEHFDFLLNDIFDSMAFDIEHFADLATGFSLDRKTIAKLKTPIKILGRVLQKFTFGHAGRLLLCSGKIDKSIRKIKLKDFAVEVVRNMYGGDEPYSLETPQGQAIYAILSRLEPLVKRAVELPFESLPDFVASIIYDPTPDSNAILPLQ